MIRPFADVVGKVADIRVITDTVIGLLISIWSPELNTLWLARIAELACGDIRDALAARTAESVARAAAAVLIVRRVQLCFNTLCLLAPPRRR
jgi:hypothetical protein